MHKSQFRSLQRSLEPHHLNHSPPGNHRLTVIKAREVLITKRKAVVAVVWKLTVLAHTLWKRDKKL